MNDREREALLKVREGLVTGRITAAYEDSEHSCQFDISLGVEKTDCGTVACIGGWMGLFMGMTEREADEYVTTMDAFADELYPLFYPSVDWDLVTPLVAIDAIDRFLETGEPKWECALHADPVAIAKRDLRERLRLPKT